MTAPRTRPPGRALLLALAVLLLALLPARSAYAHAALLSTDPADGAALDQAPDAITLRFNEAVQPVPDATRLVDAIGNEHTLDAEVSNQDVVIALPTDLGEGAYYLNWRVVSADAHPIAGVLAFTIGDAQPAAEPPALDAPEESPWASAAASTLHYLGLLVFAGFLFFRTVIARKLWPPRNQRSGTALRPRNRLLLATGLAAVLGAALAVPLGALDAAGLAAGRIADVGAWRELASADSLTVMALTAIGVAGAYAAFTRGRGRWAAPVALAAAALAVAAPAFVGHTRSFGLRALMIGADVVHLATGAIWAGGLAGLLIVLARWRRTDDPTHAAAIVARFSTWAGWTVAALGASGLVMGLSIHRDWGEFLASDHGRALIIKLALVAVALALAAWNRQRLVPLIAKAEAEGVSDGAVRAAAKKPDGGTAESAAKDAAQIVVGVPGGATANPPECAADAIPGGVARSIAGKDDPPADLADSPDHRSAGLARLRRILRFEAAIVGAVAVVTGLLVHLSPATEAAEPPPPPPGGEATLHAELDGGGSAEIHLAPGTAGENTIELILTGADGLPLEPLEPPTVSAALPERDFGPIAAIVHEIGPGSYHCILDLPLTGTWELEVQVRISEFGSESAVFTVEVGA
ncbi:copper resistance CopC/CopD family protein [Glycomyces paridis]|uniref:Copper resistance protein CopC n=1 Tax=Glycomyces paridis TaxID=2126555 RepID=A0A4S8PHF4_9ACTN|nr:copper resistance protein CopC [Glycomyces paridis]THV29045.1 hypothetical protein E9998_09885 [Glycomyces paridis]